MVNALVILVCDVFWDGNYMIRFGWFSLLATLFGAQVAFAGGGLPHFINYYELIVESM